MPRVAWLTDPHLDHVEPGGVQQLCARIAQSGAEAVLISGDIATAPSLERTLLGLARQLERPIYFVCGNHDYYHGSIDEVRGALSSLSAKAEHLHWLPSCGCVVLGPDTGLIGHGGWADGRLGDYHRSTVMLNDYLLIEELAGLDSFQRLAKLREFGEDAAQHFAAVLPEALERFAHVLVLTHVPPFRDACWYEGRISSDDWLPHFTCKAVGDVLASAMQAQPQRRMIVLCGHTHGEGTAEILPNLHVKTAGAAYGRPDIAQLLEVS